MSSLASVDFPHPDSPTRPRVSPRCSWRLTPSTARTSPIFRLKTMPCVIGKYLTRSLTSRITSSLGIEDLRPEVAAASPPEGDLGEVRRLRGADRLRSVAPRMERAARRDPGQVR